MELHNKENAVSVLTEFLSCSLLDGSSILEQFAALPNAQYHKGTHPLERFVYVPGSRADRVLLIVHADTFWDRNYPTDGVESAPVYEDNLVVSASETVGIGADDRAGCALAWLLRDSGHSLLVLDGEEKGHWAAKYIVREHKALLKELNHHAYMLALDFPGSDRCHYHAIPNRKRFCKYVEERFEVKPVTRYFGADVSFLSRSACGVNLSVGYYKVHSAQEYLKLSEWYCVYEKLYHALSAVQPQFRTRRLVRWKEYTMHSIRKTWGDFRRFLIKKKRA